MENQAYLFLVFLLNGFLIGVLFDIFRILRKTFKTNDFITYMQDILFWLLTGFIVLYSIFKFNNGELRNFIFIGIFIGISIYLLVFSKTFIKVNLIVINIIRRIIFYIIIIPFKLILRISKKIIFKPVSFIIINFRKTLSNLIIKLKNLQKKQR